MWELYDVENDPVQASDLADTEPDRLAQLVAAFDEDAWANQVYPLDEGSGVKFLQKRPQEPLSTLVIAAGTPTLERHRSSMYTRGSFDVIVDWDFQPGDEGVLVAHGDQAAGYVLFVEDDALGVRAEPVRHARCGWRRCPCGPAPARWSSRSR